MKGFFFLFLFILLLLFISDSYDYIYLQKKISYKIKKKKDIKTYINGKVSMIDKNLFVLGGNLTVSHKYICVLRSSFLD